ncbi:hypothetical protein QAD02_018881 [Eretmocerus hayati]|uniref:Uncharacterized protein n=1 Tax=Eretmocerus hayati TaxID=131215 RepID=A0ACC2PKI2_9HYME|nr:hypothetical protein QAD02_018881 [Eretmocerus hayati]
MSNHIRVVINHPVQQSRMRVKLMKESANALPLRFGYCFCGLQLLWKRLSRASRHNECDAWESPPGTYKFFMFIAVMNQLLVCATLDLMVLLFTPLAIFVSHVSLKDGDCSD